ncbi:MAG: FAD-dependent oxidoreductase [Desulfarculaceae bacterium]|nr:FAD-dependent oxidoreductase [Desulfarculaceae bacterium]MCF8071892.1 FAD-dependent oxidoreductase [Desulfarculaceae bacterium]MCF8101442.1 FAD-dependent oxidoreductase [Desulfarculaceae bacterium]MCF8114959.1 FAD-dependent oxidoreductase [Desulfarculaceae bacterium]
MSLQVVIIGAVAAGPKAGCRIKRLEPSASVIMLDRDSIISYGGCGIPFYVSGDVADLKELTSTSFHMERDPAFFAGAKGIEVRSSTEALSIDRTAKTVRVKDLATGDQSDLPYDKLVIATGSNPMVPPIPGADLEGVTPVANLHQAQAIKEAVAQGQVGAAAVIGAGATGLEMAEALADLWGVEVHLFEMAPQILPGLVDAEMARMMECHLQAQEDIHLHLGAKVQAIEGGEDGKVKAIKADGQTYEVEQVILATGVRPNAALAQEAGLDLAGNGGIQVDEFMRTSDPDIYAGGDCVSIANLVSGQPMYLPAGSLANRQGRVIGSNVCGGSARFPGAVGSWCIKLFGLSLARTGLNQAAVQDLGRECVAPLVVQADRAHFHPDNQLMYLKLVVERGTRKVLGLTALGENGDAVVGRVNAVAGLLAQGALLDDISNLELAYSPPLGSAVDVLNAAANSCDNMLAGKLRPLSPEEFSRRLAEGPGGNTVILDMRAIDNAKPFLECLAPQWCHLPQETLMQRLDEVPRDKDVVLVCNSGVRSYEAQVMLDGAGINNTYNLSGGVAAVKKWGEPILPEDEEQ